MTDRDQSSKDTPKEQSDHSKDDQNEEPTASDLSDLISRAKQVAGKAVSQAGDTAKDCTTWIGESAQDVYKDSVLQAAVETVDSGLEERGIYRTTRDTTEAIGGKVSEVTGKRLLELLEARLQKQDTYNDVLATRLAETMERVQQLERELEDLKSR